MFIERYKIGWNFCRLLACFLAEEHRHGINITVVPINVCEVDDADGVLAIATVDGAFIICDT